MGLLKAILGLSEFRDHTDKFIIDILMIAHGNTLKNAEVSFPCNSHYIIINGRREFFNAKRIDFDGYDNRDSLYKISTYDYDFWVSQNTTYKKLKNIMELRQRE